jgi:hypothetical protein
MIIDVFLKQTLTIDPWTVQAFQLIDKESFRCLLTYLRPSLADTDIPHCTKLCKDISEQAEAVWNWIKDKYPYLSITAHYINSPSDRPQDWTLRTDQLVFAQFEGNHSGLNMSSLVLRTIDWYGIWDKVCHLLFYYILSILVWFFSLVGALWTTLPIMTCV